MGTGAWLTLLVLLVTFGTLVTERFPAAAIMMTATASLYVVGVIDTAQAFSGFSNPAPLTVIALFVLASGIERTGLLSVVVSKLLGRAGKVGTAHVRLLLPVVVGSALLNNTPLVAVLIPDVIAWCRRNKRNAARYLLPLSYAAILGGTLTVLGTSTNLLVSGLLVEAGYDPIGIFELTKIGLPVATVGVVVLFGVSIPLLPHHRQGADEIADDPRNFVVEMRVTSANSVAGHTVEEAGLRNLQGVYLAQIHRANTVVAPVDPREVLVAGDVLRFVGQVDNVLDLQRMPGLESVIQDEVAAIAPIGRSLYEVVIGRTSPVLGHTLRDADFRARYGAAVLAIHRAGKRIDQKLGDVRLRHGDTLALVANGHFRRRFAKSRDFLVVAELDAPPPTIDSKAPYAAIAIFGFVVLAAFGLVSTLQGAILAAGVIMVAGITSFADAKRAVDVDVILLIGAAFGLGAAVESTGLAMLIANTFVGALGGFGTFGIVLGVVIATSILTEIVTNNAAAVVVFPIAVALAEPAGVDPRLMAMAVAIAASTSFVSPIGYQTNTMVYGPGGYRAIDYVRAGLPLSIAVQLTIATTVTVFS